jgi:hypothetical protein
VLTVPLSDLNGHTDVDNVTKGTKFEVRAKLKNGQEVSVSTVRPAESIPDLLVRKQKASAISVMRVDSSGDYEFYLGELLEFSQGYATYKLQVGSGRWEIDYDLVDVKYDSQGVIQQDGENWYVYFKSEGEHYVNSTLGRMEDRGPGDRIKNVESHEYWIPSRGDFKFKITPTGMEGGWIWAAGPVECKFSEWWNCKSQDNSPQKFLAFGS